MKLRPVPDTPRRAVIYVRQSKEKEDSISPAVQEQSCRDYAARQGYTVTDVVSDIGVTGLRWERRPGVQRVMMMVADHHVDVVLVWRWSRLSRSRLHQAVALDTIEKAGAVVESATEPFDTTTAGGMFGRDVMLAAAAFESQQKGEQWREAHRRRLDAGLPHHGRPRPGYLYDGTYQPDPELAPVMAEAYRRAITGEGGHRIAKYLGAHGIQLTERGARYLLDSGFAAGLLYVHDPACGCGRSCSHRAHVPGGHPAIISPDTWQQYQAARTATTVAPRLRTAVTRLSGLVLCDGCGRPTQFFRGRTGHARPAFYCRGDGATAPLCPARARVLEEHAETVVRDWLPTVAAEIERVPTPAPAVTRTGTARLARQIAAADTALTNLTLDHARRLLPEAAYLAARDELLAERDTAQAELDRITTAARQLEGFVPAAAGLIEVWDIAPIPAVNRLGRTLFRVRATRGEQWGKPLLRVVGLWELS